MKILTSLFLSAILHYPMFFVCLFVDFFNAFPAIIYYFHLFRKTMYLLPEVESNFINSIIVNI